METEAYCLEIRIKRLWLQDRNRDTDIENGYGDNVGRGESGLWDRLGD